MDMKENYDEQKFLESFRRAIRREEDALQMKRKRGLMRERHTLDVFRDNGQLTPEWISSQFCLVLGGISKLPTTQRQYLLNLGKVASVEYNKMM